MISACDLIADGYHQRAKRWHGASLCIILAGIAGVVGCAQPWPMLIAFLLSMAAHRQSNRNMDRAQAVIEQGIATLRAELREMGIDPDE